MNKNRALILSALSEKEFMRHVIDLARGLGWLTYHPFDSRRSAEGYPDLTLVKAPRVIFAELKSDRVRLDKAVTAYQRAWLDTLRLCPVESYLWRPRDMEQIEQILGLQTYAAAALFGDVPIVDDDIRAVDRGIAKGLRRTIGRSA